MVKRIYRIFLGLIVLLAAAVIIYNLPPVHSRLAWRVDELTARIRYAIKPPEKAIFVPQGHLTATLLSTLLPLTPSSTPTTQPSTTPTHPPNLPTPTVTLTFTPSPSPTAIPGKATLAGIVHEYQKMNNCGPANLAMALSFWKWQGTQVDTAAYLKPNQDDKNVMPYEMADYVTTQTNLKIVVRLGGDIQTLKRLIAAGYPVIVEKGFEGSSFPGWMGHYEVLSGYDDGQAVFTAQDSYEGPNRPVAYDTMISNWRAFDFIFLVIYPPENESDVLAILGPLADEQAAFEHSAQVALDETGTLKDRDLYFAWFNRGSSLVKLGDYGGAAAAYDQAFSVYPNIAEAKRPWRMLWYQTGPYFAYYYTGRYNDIVSLATQSLDAANIPTLEESYVWRARAEVMLGQRDKAIEDLRLALKYHPGFEAALVDLQQLGVSP